MANIWDDFVSDEPQIPEKDNNPVEGTKKPFTGDLLIPEEDLYPRQDFENEIEYNPDLLILSASLIKQISNKYEELHPCPKRIYHCYIIKDQNTIVTDSMSYGSYFETLCLGSGRRGETTTDLPRAKKDNSKKAPQRKIDGQVLLFRNIIERENLVLYPQYNTQIKIFKHYKANIYLSGELDWFPVVIDNEIWIIDLKLTGNVNSEWGDFAWGNPQQLDFIQPDMYLNLVQNIDFDLNDKFNPGNHLRLLVKDIKDVLDNGEARFKYFLFGYGCKEDPDLLAQQVKTNIERELTDQKQAELKERIDKAVASLRMMKNKEWPAVFNAPECNKCPMSKVNGGDCESSTENEVY